MPKKHAVRLEDLTITFLADIFDFDTTDDLSPLDSVIGQTRAVEAIDFSLNMKTPGYNLFLTGDEGTGKSTIVNSILAKHAAKEDTPEDICLVHNFDDAYCPIPIHLPSGTAIIFKRQMARFIEGLKILIPKSFEDEAFQKQEKKIQEKYQEKNNNALKDIEAFAEPLNIGIAKTEEGYTPVPLHDNQPMDQKMYDSLPEEEQNTLMDHMEEVREKLNGSLKELGELDDEMQEAVKELISSKIQSIVVNQITILRTFIKKVPAVKKYLESVQEDIVDNMALFIGNQGVKANHRENKEIEEIAQKLLKRYQVNVMVSHRKNTGAPIIFESNPSFCNLFGIIEKNLTMGGHSTDFTMVQAGSLLKANQGYLIMEIEPLLTNPLVWETLKTSLQNQMLQIEDNPDHEVPGANSLKPLPIDLTVKVILMGSYETFRLIQQLDSKFNKLFKVRADFDNEVKITKEVMLQYARFVKSACKAENLLPFNKDAVARVVEYGSRLVADQSRLSLRFGQIMGVLKEADYWAKKGTAKVVSIGNMEKAIAEFRFRNNLYEEKVHQGFVDNTVLIDVAGKKVGQVNALAVYQMGNIAFGRPTRITAESYMGEPGIINVEHEANMSGETHDKGVLIISGFLGRMFAQDYPLNVSISITFEQSYSGVDGDSASSTELYTVLSSLSGIPINQGIAVTGSVNQKGEIQAIGGVNEKIEGYYDVCLQKGLTGDQGVMIPASNVKNLMLRIDVIESVRKGQFHIYQAKTIQEGIHVLFGKQAGVPDAQNQYPKATVFGAVQAKLKRFYDQAMIFKYKTQ
ncbi:MAG: AAA family ATPase [Desulfobacteraceae bacterium]|nr:AAA family ATPase [Desulfobacteraceae bacterium]